MHVSKLSVFLGVVCVTLLVVTCVTLTLLVRRQHDGPLVGLTDTTPEKQYRPVNIYDIQKEAAKKLSAKVLAYYEGGATFKTNTKENVAAFGRYRLLPYYLVNVSNADTSTTILGEPVSAPIAVSPTGFHRWAHPEGENATARACARKQMLMGVSHASSILMERIAAAAPGGLRWQQIYLVKVRAAVLFLVRRAEAASYRGIIVTVDRPVSAINYNSRRKIYSYDWMKWMVNYYGNTTLGYMPTATQTFTELCWLRTQTKLKLVVKGILRADDAVRAVNCGADAIFVSNHGGRVLDGVPATIDVLPSVVAAVAGRAEVYLDSGVRSGMDIAKAIALGARAVFVGRAVLNGLAYDGQRGVESVLSILHQEFTNTMQLLGADHPDKLNSSMILKPGSCVGSSVCGKNQT